MEKSDKIYISVAQGLLDAKHVKAFGPTPLFLYLWFIDRMTTLSGSVLGGKPIKYKEVKTSLGITHRTYTRWMLMLQEGGYIEVVQAPYGLVVTVTKAKKIFNQKLKKRVDSGGYSEKERVDKSVHPESPHLSTPIATSGYSNKTRQLDKTKRQDKEREEAAPPTLTPAQVAAKNFLDFWNKVHGSRYSAYDPIADNLAYWLTQYSKQDVARAVQLVKLDKFWAKKMTPTILLRRANPGKEKVDRIGDLLNLDTHSDSVPGGGKLIKNLK